MQNKTFYESRIIKALDYINRHLDEAITIDQLAQVSHFSSFHFQRIYKALLDESPYDTVLRLRLEKAVFLIKNQAKSSLIEVANLCGFPSYENFSRQFKKRFSYAPSVFKKDKTLQNSRIYQEDHPNDFYTRIMNPDGNPILVDQHK